MRISNTTSVGVIAFRVTDNTMAPRIDVGEIVWAHPNRRPSPGDDCVFRRCTDNKIGEEILVKELARTTSSAWIARQLNPYREFMLPRAEWLCCQILDIDLDR